MWGLARTVEKDMQLILDIISTTQVTGGGITLISRRSQNVGCEGAKGTFYRSRLTNPLHSLRVQGLP